MGWLPRPVERLLDVALVGELTVIGRRGRPITHPLIPLYDGERVYLHSSTLFSRKLAHIKRDPRVCLALTDPVAMKGNPDRATIQGIARVIEDDPHRGWERLVLDLWRRKEPVIDAFLRQRVALPLFFERAVIEITPTRCLYWPSGGTHRAPQISTAPEPPASEPIPPMPPGAERSTSAVPSSSRPARPPQPDDLARLGTYPHVVMSWIGDDGYPVSVATSFETDPSGGIVRLARPAGLTVPPDRELSVIGSHIHPTPGQGYDQRRYLELWGRAASSDGHLIMRSTRAWGWDETDIPFFEYAERSVPQSRRYLAQLSAERGRTIKPRLALGWLALRTTRLPFLSATVIPVLLGIAVAARHGTFDPWLALLTLVGAALAHLGINVTNDVFDTVSGADAANVNPTKYSGGSRVALYDLVSLRGLVVIAAALLSAAIAIGLALMWLTGAGLLLPIGIAGLAIGVAYTAPPFRLVHRGVGELAVALGFGPITLVGSYVVQTGRITLEPVLASIPVAILVALILYVNEIPDRAGDAAVGKRTLPVRWSPRAVRLGYAIGAVVAFAVIAGGVLAGLLPWPTLAALVALPLAVEVYRGLQIHYDSPYTLMAVMGTNIRLHLAVGALLLAAYVVVILATALHG